MELPKASILGNFSQKERSSSDLTTINNRNYPDNSKRRVESLDSIFYRLARKMKCELILKKVTIKSLT